MLIAFLIIKATKAALRLLSDCLLSDHHLFDRRFPDRTYPDHNNIPDHRIDVYIYFDLQLSRPTVIPTYSYPHQFIKIFFR